MRTAYLSMDRPDLLEAVKLLASRMSAPREADLQRLQRLGQFLKGHPCLVTVFRPQQMPDCITITVDSDYAGEGLHRRSTSGVVTQFGVHTLRCQCNYQSVVALSSGEAEYYAIVRGAQQGLYMTALAADLGVQLQTVVSGRPVKGIEVYSDSSAARAFAQRMGLGAQKHVSTRYLWIQERARSGDIVIKKVGTKVNIADCLTKVLAGTAIRKHLQNMGFEYRTEWSSLHRSLENESKSNASPENE
eukprot:6468467-Amphidinium_carterae.1